MVIVLYLFIIYLSCTVFYSILFLFYAILFYYCTWVLVFRVCYSFFLVIYVFIFCCFNLWCNVVLFMSAVKQFVTFNFEKWYTNKIDYCHYFYYDNYYYECKGCIGFLFCWCYLLMLLSTEGKQQNRPLRTRWTRGKDQRPLQTRPTSEKRRRQKVTHPQREMENININLC